MDNNEEYLLKVLHRTENGLQDSLIPAHGAKLKRIVDHLERARSLSDAIKYLLTVQGFSKCALVMEWLMLRTKRPEEEFSPEQFESDVLLLNEKIFEAFLNQPFDMPDFGKPAETTVPIREIHQDFQVSTDEFIGAETTTDSLRVNELNDTDREGVAPILAEPNWDTSSPVLSSLENSLQHTPSETTYQSESSPPLREMLDADLLEVTKRIVQNAVEFADKSQNERPVSASVLRMNARSGVESARNSNNVIVQDFYQALVKLINTADELGKIKNDVFAEALRDVGDRLSIALNQSNNGVALLKNITNFINDPKEILGKK